MRYSDTHKQETRKKVVRAAAAAVRAKGPTGWASRRSWPRPD